MNGTRVTMNAQHSPEILGNLNKILRMALTIDLNNVIPGRRGRWHVLVDGNSLVQGVIIRPFALLVSSSSESIQN